MSAFVHGDENTKIALKINASEHAVNITVADNGKGITGEETDRLFERYFRGTNTERKTEGAGLGLAIAKNIVEFHRGRISVSSTPNVGTVFLICLERN